MVKWTQEVRRADPNRRARLRESFIALEAVLKLSQDTGATRYAFEAIENFPLYDLLRWSGERLPLLRDPRFLELYRARSMPDLRTASALSMLEYPEGTVGRAYAEYVRAKRLDNLFLEYLEIDGPGPWLAYRVAHLHDLFHFVLGYDAFDPIGEMEIEAYLFAQTGGWNHLCFLLGYAMFLARNQPKMLLESGPRLRAAHARGRSTENLLLVRWEELMRSPLSEVRARLGLSDTAPSPANPEPTAAPRLAHVVFNVPDLERAVLFYRRVHGYQVVARDESLGAVFLSGGDDHHTVALQETPSFGPLGLLRGARRLAALARGRRSSARSDAGRPRVLPTLPVVLASLRTGFNHAGYRVESEEDLRGYVRRLRSAGVSIDWMVNHHDLVKGIYFRDPGGNLCELFVDGDRARELADARARGVPLEELGLREELRNYELSPKELGL